MRLLCKFNGTVGELTDALTAAEIAANTIPKAKVYFRIKDQKLAPIVRSAWFVKGVLGPDEDVDGFDAVVEMTSDRDRTYGAELAHREKVKQIIDDQLQSVSKSMQIPVDKLKKPGGYEILSSTTPIWDRAMGYLMAISESHPDASVIGELALTITGPGKPVMLSPHGRKQMANKYLHKHRTIIRPGVPYLVVGNAEDLVNLRGLEFPVPKGWARVLVNEDTDPELVIGLIDNSRCAGVVSMSGGISRIAWAAGTSMILEFVETEDGAYWTSVKSGKSATVDLSHEETTNETIANTLRAMYRLSHEIEME